MTHDTPRIVAGVSELAGTDPTLRAAVELARHSGAELHLVHAYQLPAVMSMPPGLQMVYPEGTERYAHGLRVRMEEAARDVPGGEAATCHLVLGGAAASVVEVAQQVGAELVVVGAAHGTRLGRAVLGTTAQRVLRDAPMPVLVVRTHLELPPRRVLLTTDLSDFSAAVHDTALDTVDLFFRAPREVRSLLVLGWAAVAPPLTSEGLERAGRSELEAFLHARGCVGPQVEPVVRTGLTAEEIVAETYAWNPDLLVLGTHARRWGARMMMGSVAEAALRDAPCNVLVVPPMPTAAVAVGADAHAESADLRNWLDATE